MSGARESIYHDAAQVLQDLEGRKGSLKSLVFSLPLSLSNKKAVYALTAKTLQYKSHVEAVIQRYGLLKKEPKLSLHVSLVLVFDLLYNKRLKPRGPLTRTILQHKNGLMERLKEVEIEKGAKVVSKTDLLPRYARINTLKISPEHVVEELKGLGFKPGKLDEINQEELWFCFDDLIPNLLVFSSSPAVSSLLTSSSLYKSFKIILQDKSSCLPVHVLSPPPGSSVIDCCAAPGNKTSQLAAIMNNTGTVYAFDRDRSRYDVMKKMLVNIGATSVKTFNEDFLKVKPEQYCDVQYMIVDPSCSGSGMVRRVELNDGKTADKKRLKSLSCFQTMILKHALSFPCVQKVVYSTCSIHREENEDVIGEVLSQCSTVYELVNVLPKWKTRGVSQSPVGSHCIRVVPSLDKAQGFFLALLQRRTDIIKDL